MNLYILDSEISEVRRLKQAVQWEQFGFRHVSTAYSEEKAWKAIEQAKPDLVICDIGFSDHQGLALLGRIREENPSVELVVTGKNPGSEQFRDMLHLEVLDYLEKPISAKAIEQTLDLFRKKQQVRRSVEQSIQKSRYWERNHALVQEMFWKNLCLNRIAGGPEEIEEAARLADVNLDKDTTYEMVLITMKNQDEMWSVWGENGCQSAIQNLAREAVKQPENGSMVVIIYSRVAILLGQDELENVDEKCRILIERCREELGAEILCYISEPVFCEKMPDVYNRLLAYSKDDVLRQKRIVHVKNIRIEDNGGIAIPKTWEDYFYSSNPLLLVQEVRTFLTSRAQQGQLSEQNFRVFQQDMLQLFFTYMEKKERSAHELYDNPTIYKLYKVAIMSVDGMCQWVKTCTEYLTQGVGSGQREQKNGKIVAQIKEYIRGHLSEDLMIEQIAHQIHISPDYMTKIFKKETGMTVKEYLIKKRMSRAKELLRTSENSVSRVALEVGYDNLSYFIKKFQSCYGVTPKQFQKKAELH